MIRHNVKQRSVEWDRLRIGIPTASEFSRIITPATHKLSTQADGYMDWLLACWIVGEILERPETEYMHVGQELEARAAQEYAFAYECELSTIGFVTTDNGNGRLFARSHRGNGQTSIPDRSRCGD